LDFELGRREEEGEEKSGNQMLSWDDDGAILQEAEFHVREADGGECEWLRRLWWLRLT
jgi:hypothetical protein